MPKKYWRSRNCVGRTGRFRFGMFIVKATKQQTFLLIEGMTSRSVFSLFPFSIVI
ncbi:hypothetical protein LINPERPRIM_LOCUS38989 [Linum perenne]